MNPLNTHADITRLTLKQQLAVDPYKALGLLETLLTFIVVMSVVLFVGYALGITDTFKTNLLCSGTLGASIGMAYSMYREAALAEWRVTGHVSPEALRSAMAAVKYAEAQPGVYYPKKRMFTPFHRCDSERITLTTVNDGVLFKGPHNKLKALAALQLTEAVHTPG